MTEWQKEWNNSETFISEYAPEEEEESKTVTS